MESEATQTAKGVLWINGELGDFQTAQVSLEDRGFQFGDGIYEVARVYQGVPFMFAEHIARLFRSAAGIELAIPISGDKFSSIARELLNRFPSNGAEIYIQITRGIAPRNLLWAEDLQPTIIIGVRPLRFVPPALRETGCSAITLPDERWARCDLKTICLLPNALAKKRAARAGVFDALMIRDNLLTEGTASNVFLFLNQTLVTPAADNRILHGLTRGVVLKVARERGYRVIERNIKREELYEAQEVFLTSTSLELMPVVKIDDQSVGAGVPGYAQRDLQTAFRSFAQKH